METTVLEDLGLTAAEIKIYLSLLELGKSRAGEIIAHSGLQNSVFHDTIGKLIEKKFVLYAKRGRIKEYRPTDPRNILKWFDEKKERFETYLPKLLSKHELQGKQEAEVAESIKGFQAICYKLVEDAKPGDDYLVFSYLSKEMKYDKEDEPIYSFYRDFVDYRLKRGIVIKALASAGGEKLIRKIGFDLSYWKFVHFPIIQNISICGDKIMMTPFEDKRVVYLINSKQVADNFRDYFYWIWDNN